MCELCEDTYSEQYENVIACSSKQVNEFVEWIKQQEFYDNTTIVIVGDHCSMDSDYMKRNLEEGYERRVYNCIINAPMQSQYEKNREFTAFDMFPTTLAAMGCQIEGERLGLGTNLFSGEQTLIEKMGKEALNAELSKASEYYTKNFFFD